MQFASLFDAECPKNAKYSYFKRGLDTSYPPDMEKESLQSGVYTRENGNLFSKKSVGWRGEVILQGSVDISIKTDEELFFDHISLEHRGGIKSIEVFDVKGGAFIKIGALMPQTGEMLSCGTLTVNTGCFASDIRIRLNADCRDIIIESVDVWCAWDIEPCPYPTPEKIEYTGGRIMLCDIKTVSADGDDKGFAADYLAEKLLKLHNHTLTKASQNADISFEIKRIGENDAFCIDVSGGKVRIFANDRRCLIYAADAFLQLIDNGSIRECRIEDEAFLPMRGFHIALPFRNQMGFLKKLIKNVLVPMRYNMVFVEVASAMRYDNYPEINDAWLNAIDKYKKGEWPRPAHYGFVGGDILEKSEVRDLCDYMESFGIEVIPEIQSYGHTQYLTMAYPDAAEKYNVSEEKTSLKDEDKRPDTFYWRSMCPLGKDYYNIIFGVASEVIDVFRPKRFVHMGHDEIYDIGMCPKCRKADKAKLFSDEVNRLNEYVKSKGLTMMIWSDMLQNMKYSVPLAAKAVSRDIVMLDFVWYFHLDEDIETNLTKHGFNVMIGNLYTSHFPRYEKRVRRKGICGAEVSAWVACNEEKYAYNGKMYEAVFAAEALWSSRYSESMRLSYNEKIKPILKDIRYAIADINASAKQIPLDIGAGADNIPYDIPKTAQHGSAALLSASNPSKSVSVNKKCEAISFIHATDIACDRLLWAEPRKIGEYVIEYDDESTYTEDISYALNIFKYRSVYGEIIKSPLFRHLGYAGTYMTVPECGKTYDGSDYTIGKYTVKNPFPDKNIKSIKLNHMKNTDAKIIVFGITLM